jgi:MYXO-CTERM domain-containing protein
VWFDTLASWTRGRYDYRTRTKVPICSELPRIPRLCWSELPLQRIFRSFGYYPFEMTMRRALQSVPGARRRPLKSLRFAPGLAALAWLAAPPAHALTLATGDPASSFTVTPLVNGLSQPTDMAELPDGRVVVTQRLGDITVVNTNGDTVDSGHINVYPEFGEQGLLGVVADPDFATNHYLYFYASAGTTSEDPVNKHKIFRIKLGDDGMLDAQQDKIVDKGLRASRSSVDGGASNHNGGGMIIYKGLLYFSTGDTGHNKTPPNNELGTCLNWPNGKINRINLDGTTPADNPLAGESMVTGCDDWNTALKDEAPNKMVFAWGFRNPYRFWIDPKTSRMWVGDVGETTREEFSTGSPIDNGGDGSKGEHYGWPFAEGTTKYTTSQQSFQPSNSCMGIKPARACIAPQYDYGHSDGNNCIIGGLIPDGCGWAAPWNNRYFFGDNGSGRIWYADVNTDRSGIVAGSVKEFAGNKGTQGVGSFRMGANGVLYIAEVSGGVVDKVVPKGYDPTMCGSSGTGSGGMSAGGGAGMSAGGASSGGTGSGGRSAGGGAGMSAGGATMAGGSAGTASAAGGTTGGTGTGGTGTGGTGTGGTGTGGTGTGGTATGGTGTGGTGTGGTGTGGTTGGAMTGGAGKGAAGTSGGNDSSGCGCRVAGPGPNVGGLLVMSGLLGLFGARRRRRAS